MLVDNSYQLGLYLIFFPEPIIITVPGMMDLASSSSPIPCDFLSSMVQGPLQLSPLVPPSYMPLQKPVIQSNLLIKLMPRHKFMLCVHYDLDLCDMTLGQGHDTPHKLGLLYMYR